MTTQIDPKGIFKKLVEYAEKFAPKISSVWTSALWTCYLYVFFNECGLDYDFEIESGKMNRGRVLYDLYWLEGTECKLVLEVENTCSKLERKIDLLIDREKCKTQFRVLIGSTGACTPEKIKENREDLVKKLKGKLMKKPIEGRFLLIFVDTACPHLRRAKRECPRMGLKEHLNGQDCKIQFKGYLVNSDGSTIQLGPEEVSTLRA